MNLLQPQAEKCYAEALGYMKTLEKSLSGKSKFTNELRYQMSAMTIEKMLVALLAHYEINATHHTPLALIHEAETVHKIPENIKETAKLIGKFESICSVEGFGYKMPNDEELRNIVIGLIEVKDFVGKVLQAA